MRLREVLCVGAFAHVLELVAGGRTTGAERVAVAVELDAAQLRVDALAVGVVLDPQLDRRVDVAASVGAARLRRQRRAVAVDDGGRGVFLSRGADEEVAGEPVVLDLGVAVVQRELVLLLQAAAVASSFGVKTFKDLPADKWADALAAVNAKLAELESA